MNYLRQVEQRPISGKDDHEELMSFLTPVLQIWDQNHSTVDDAISNWEHALLNIPILEKETTLQENWWFRNFSEESRIAKDGMRQWFLKTNSLSKTEIKRIHRLALFTFDSIGYIRLRKPPIKLGIATVIISLLASGFSI